MLAPATNTLISLTGASFIDSSGERRRRGPKLIAASYTSGRELALEAQEFVGLDPVLSIVILGRDGTLPCVDELGDDLGAHADVTTPATSPSDSSRSDGTKEPARVAEIYSISVADVEQAVDVEHHHGDLSRAA